jgi:hypothetical protein
LQLSRGAREEAFIIFDREHGILLRWSFHGEHLSGDEAISLITYGGIIRYRSRGKGLFLH